MLKCSQARKQKTNDSCDSNRDKPSFRDHKRAPLPPAATRVRNCTLPMSGQTAKRTNTRAAILIPLPTSQSLTVRAAAQL